MTDGSATTLQATDTTVQDVQSGALPPSQPKEEVVRDWMFWFIFVSLMITTFMYGLESVVVGNALPVIVNRFESSQFVWIGTAYSLAACAFLPLIGVLSQITGRRPVMVGSIALFAVGSAVCGAAQSMNVLIVGRTLQGVGGGGIVSLAQIILSDLVPLSERGIFNGLIAIAFTIANCIGPVVGGSLAQTGQWRWIFYLNIPICGLTAVMSLIFLRLKTPAGSMQEKLKSMDWIGNVLVISSTTAVVLGLTWGGVQFPWDSAKVLVPLILGLVGLCAFLLYEAVLAPLPMIPLVLMSNRTALSGYTQTFVNQIVLFALIYYLPTYFQACKDASPIAGGVDVFGLACTTAPMALAAGASVTASSRYRPQIWFAWAMTMIGCGLLCSLDADSSRANAIGFQIPIGLGIGIVYTTTYFPVLASVPITENARALSFFIFLRNLAAVWGIAIGGTILQNGLRKNLPEEFSNAISESTQIAYAIVPQIPHLQQPLKDEVRRAFADSMRVIWQVLTGLSGLGLVASLFMKGLPLHTATDKEWGLQERNGQSNNLQELKKKNSSQESVAVVGV